ncbi:hypothetical protein RB653_001967 [Dictyostelium firmibasis]|uniref:BolA-like protein n=1 Tax=Dictyostelium firmibasis TaxID=79012 RepID=A0AAN7TXR6_9MYCE
MISRFFIQTTKVSQIRTFCSIPKNPKETEILNILQKELNPTFLNIFDMSGGCGSMFKIEITSPEFINISTLNRHRKVNDVLRRVIPTLHGITLVTRDPNELLK